MKKILTLLFLSLCASMFGQVNVTFVLNAVNQDGIAVDTTDGVYIVGDINGWVFEAMEDLGDQEYEFFTSLNPGDTLSYSCNLVNSWDSVGNGDWNYYKKFKEPFDPETFATCTPTFAKWEGDRWFIVPTTDTIIEFSWGVLCEDLSTGIQSNTDESSISVINNLGNGEMRIQLSSSIGLSTVKVYDITGKVIESFKTSESNFLLDLSGSPAGVYMLTISNGTELATKKILIQ